MRDLFKYAMQCDVDIVVMPTEIASTTPMTSQGLQNVVAYDTDSSTAAATQMVEARGGAR